MLADPILNRVAKLLHKHRLDAVLIGNAAAALQGAPVTTLDLDFMFRKTIRNLQKLKKVARDLDASILRPYYPVSDLYRLMRDGDGLQLDFMAKIDGIRSFASLRSRSTTVKFGGCELRVASLEDVIHSKAAANRPRTGRCCQCFAVLFVKHVTSKRSRRRRTALRRETDRALGEQIRRRLALPMARRTNFLRRRLPGGGSAF